jgi:hypothetical protein
MMIYYKHDADEPGFILTAYHTDCPAHPIAWIGETGKGYELHTYHGAVIRRYQTLTETIIALEDLYK